MTYRTTEEIAQDIAADLAGNTAEAHIVRRCVTHMSIVLEWPAVSVRAMLPEVYPLVRACVRAKESV